MEYTLLETHEKIRQFADKMGSDYFPLPVILNYFQTSVYDFIGERLKYVEMNQEITDDIRPLIVSRRILVVPKPQIFISTSNPPLPHKYIAPLPVNYLRTVAYDILYENGERCRRADLMTQSEFRVAINDPHKEPSKKYPAILQEEDFFHIDCGDTVAEQMYLVYCKKPTIATTGDKSKRVVNLPDDAIEKILLKTVTSLFAGKEDQRAQSNAAIEETFRNVFK